MAVRRFRLKITAIVVFAVILFAACISVSFAWWNASGTSSTATASGKIGLFYVDYDKPYVETQTSTITRPADLKDNIDDGEKNSVVLKFKRSTADSTPITVKFVFNVDGNGISQDNLFFHIWIGDNDFTSWKSAYLDNRNNNLATLRTQISARAWSEFKGFIIADSYNNIQSSDSAVKVAVGGELTDNTVYTMTLTKVDDGITVSNAVAAPYEKQVEVSVPVVKYGEEAKTLRQVRVDGTNTYKNYVCIKREYEWTSGGEQIEAGPSAAYIDFEVVGEDLNATVTDFSVRRKRTSADGIPQDGGETMTVFGSPVGKTLGDINGNTYLTVDFGAGRDKFYDLEVSLTTSAAATFVLSANATYRDSHEYKVANSYYLGVGDFGMRQSVYVGTVDSASSIDKSITVTLAAGDEFKLFATSDGADGNITANKYFGIKSKNATGAYVPNITYSPADISSYFTPPAYYAGDGSNVGVRTAGKYRLRWHGAIEPAHDENYTVAALEITLVEPPENDEDLDEETTEAGYYVTGAFAEDKTYAGLKMTPHADTVGVYEATTTALKTGNAFDVVYRAKDGDEAIKLCSMTVGANNAADGDAVKVAFDALTAAAPDLSAAHRFVADFGEVNIDGATMTLNYRATIDGASKSVALVPAANGEFGGKYFADVADTNIASVTFKATNDQLRHNSFDINAVTVGRRCDFEFKSYVVKQTALVGSGNKANWTGVANSYANGEYGADIPFGLNLATVSEGYAVMYNKSDNTKYTFGNAFIPMRASEDPNWDYTVDLDTRAGRDYNVLIGKKFLIYHNGNAVSADLDDGIIRITHEENSHTYGIVNHEKAQGKFVIKVRKSFFDASKGQYTDNLNISFIAGGAVDERPITQASASASGYYIMGQFSGWEIYPSNRMTETGVYGVYTATLDSVITTSDIVDAAQGVKAGKFKIVYIPSSGNFAYYGAAAGKVVVGGDSGSNMEITSDTFYFDSFNCAHDTSAAKAYPTKADLDKIYRIVYDNTGNGLTNLRVHYWDDGKEWGNGNTNKVSNWSTGGNITSTGQLNEWKDRPNMIDGGNGYWYYDIRSDAQYYGTYMTLSGVKLSHADGSDANQSINFAPNFVTTDGVGCKSYIIRYEKATKTWTGAVYKGVEWTDSDYVEPTLGDEEIQIVKLGAGDHWALSYDITAKNALASGWYFGAYVGATRQLVGVEMSAEWDPSINIYGHIFPKPENNPIERAALSQAAIALLESASEDHPVTVMFVRADEWVRVYASDGATSMHLGSVTLKRFIANDESDVIEGVGIYTYTNEFGYGWRNKTPEGTGDDTVFVDMFGNPTITDIKYAIGERAVADACDEYKIILTETDCSTALDAYYIGDYITLIADEPQVGTAFSHFEVDGVKIDGDTFLATKSLHRAKAVYVGVSRIVVEEHEEYVKTADGFVTLPTAQVIAPDGSVDENYTVTVSVTDSENKSYTVTDGVADISWYVGSLRLKVTYYAQGLAGRDTEIVYLTVQRDGDSVTVFDPKLRSVGLIDDAGRGDVEFDARVKHGDDSGSIKFTPNSDEYGIYIEDFDFVGYDTVEFYVFTENAPSGMFAGTFWAHDTNLISGEWVKVTVKLDSDIYLRDNNGGEIRPNTDGKPMRGKLAIRIRNGKDTPVWISSVRAYRSGV